MAKSKDLFDDTTMTFGEHLESLRIHLFKALLGLIVAIIATLTWGNRLVDVIRTPIDQALKRNGVFDEKDATSFWSELGSWFGKSSPETAHAAAEAKREEKYAADPNTIVVHIKREDLMGALHQADPARFPAVEQNAAKRNAVEQNAGKQNDIAPIAEQTADAEPPLALPLSAKAFEQFRRTSDKMDRPVTLNVQEAFMMYIKVAMVSALIFSSPWIFYQLWQFVAAGLYPHERRYVHVYMPMSIGLFMLGAAFCFYVALPVLLDFLLSYNRWLHVIPQIRLSEWVGFVILLPLMFGVSFQLPLVMLFLERISIFKVSDYRGKRRLAIFCIAVLAMVLSPGGDPGSMLLMFFPLVLLYEFGILLCGMLKTPQPFEEPALS